MLIRFGWENAIKYRIMDFSRAKKIFNDRLLCVAYIGCAVNPVRGSPTGSNHIKPP